MAEENENAHVEPVLAVKLTRAIWVLVFAVLWLGYMITSFEDSVETVDADDKVIAYRNWLGLMKGDLESTFTKNEKKTT